MNRLAGIASTSTLAFIARLTMGVSLLVATVFFVDLDDLCNAMAEVDPLMFWVAAALSGVGTIVLPAIATNSMLRVGGIRLGMWQLVRINLAMRFYVLTLPHAITVGIRWHRYNKEREKGWEIAALILFERVAQLLAVAGFALVFLLMAFPTLPASLHVLVPLGAGLNVVALVLLLTFVSPRVFGMVNPWIGQACNRLPNWISRRIERLRTAISDFQKLDSRRFGLVLLCATGWYLCLIASGYFASEGLGAGLTLVDIGWMRSTIFLLTLIPVTVGGIGVREAGFAFLFELSGIGYSTGLAFGLVLLAIQLLIGLLGLLTEARSIAADFRRTRHVRHER